jgi:hypothetical protein
MANWRAGVKRAAFVVMLAGAAVAGLGARSQAAESPSLPGSAAVSAAPVASPYIYAPSDMVVGESDAELLGDLERPG